MTPEDPWLFLAPDEGGDRAEVSATPPQWSAPRGVRLASQEGADLGARMTAALSRLLGEGPSLILGSDAPDLPSAKSTSLNSTGGPRGLTINPGAVAKLES